MKVLSQYREIYAVLRKEKIKMKKLINIAIICILNLVLLYSQTNEEIIKKAVNSYYTDNNHENWIKGSSSVLKEKGKSEFFYGINNLSDKDPATAWVEGNPSEGIGEYILLFVPRINEKGRRFSFSYDEDNDIKIFLNVTNGYCKSEDLFYKNNRVKKARITIYDVPVTASVNSIYVKGEPVKIKEEIIELTDDLRIPQSFTFITKLNKNKDAPKPKVVLKFEILEVYKGTKYNDTAISEIEVWGEYVTK